MRPPRARLAVFTLAALGSASARAAPPVAGCAHLRLVGAAAEARAVLASVSDLVAEDFPGVDAAVAPEFSVDRLFAVDDRDASCPTAWVVVKGARADVRVSGAGGTRFVFRELAVGSPLAELDRERVGQVARAALIALGQDTEALDRPSALAAAGVAAPPAAARALQADDRPVLQAGPRLPALDRYAVDVWYGGYLNQSYVWQGPGVTLAVGGTPWPLDPQLWVDAQFVLPHGFEQQDVANQTTTLRLGVSVGRGRWRAGLGAGFDRESIAFGTSGPVGLGSVWFPAARASLHATFFESGPFVAGATLQLDAVRSEAHSTFLNVMQTISFYTESFWRPGLTLTLGWRS